METRQLFDDSRVIVVAPSGHDAANTAQVLQGEQIPTHISATLQEACAEARKGIGALLFTQESVTTQHVQDLLVLLEEQPPWSDIPLILLASGFEPDSPSFYSIKHLGNSSAVTVLERPLRMVTLVSAVKASLRARRRQYQVRDLLQQRDVILGELRERAERLESSQTELMAAKEQISCHAAELEQTIADRTARLRETIAQLEAFSYSISHDMRGPLRAMQQYSKILFEDFEHELKPEAAEYLSRIMRGAHRLDRLIQDVLTYSRAARVAMPIVPVDLDKLVRDIVQQYPAFQPPTADVQVTGPLPKVLGNEASLTQCISNLLANAVKFVKKGETAKVRVFPGYQNGSVQICFEDNGIGIAPENQQRIFNIFERIHHDREYEGTGIGLSIVKKTVERMGGDVGVQSEVGRGSTFWIKLQPAKE
ncbi:MAG TPA: ATP-binding protein [Candidatus Dormibacteraeota bacterium]|nr:ATP-binding protein [Candidatus Dormibacteraeota bacterium]